MPFAIIKNLKALALHSFESSFFDSLKEFATAHPHKQFLVGINNMSHIPECKRLQEISNISFFVDIYIYVANQYTIEFLQKGLSKIVFAYYWVEGDHYVATSKKSPLPLIDCQDKGGLPYFISRGCYHKHNHGGCPKKCKKDFKEQLNNGPRSFEVHTKNCLSFLFLKT